MGLRSSSMCFVLKTVLTWMEREKQGPPLKQMRLINIVHNRMKLYRVKFLIQVLIWQSAVPFFNHSEIKLLTF